MISTNQQTLSEFAEVLFHLENEVYTASCSALSNASIGEHTRHTIELYQCLLNGYANAEVNYDKRKRDKHIEQDVTFAIKQIQEIQNALQKPDKKLFIEYELNGETFRIESNYYREVMYNLEHIIHHQALIKVAIRQLSNFVVPESFGVAPSTLQFRKQGAQ